MNLTHIFHNTILEHFLEKTNNMKKLVFTTIALLLVSLLDAQDYISSERKSEITTSSNYYWAQGFDLKNRDLASDAAFRSLTDLIISDVVNTTIKKEELLKGIEMGAHFDLIQVRKGICVIAWIAKDSVFITTKRPMQSTQPTDITDPILQALINCKNYQEIKKTTTKYGMRTAMNSTENIEHVEQCIIAVFSSDGSLKALLDKGKNTRRDLMSNTQITNPENYYHTKNYNLLYLLKK